MTSVFLRLKDRLRLVLTSLCSVFRFSNMRRTVDRTAVTVFTGPHNLRSWSVMVWSGHGLFPVLWPDFQTLCFKKWIRPDGIVKVGVDSYQKGESVIVWSNDGSDGIIFPCREHHQWGTCTLLKIPLSALRASLIWARWKGNTWSPCNLLGFLSSRVSTSCRSSVKHKRLIYRNVIQTECQQRPNGHQVWRKRSSTLKEERKEKTTRVCLIPSNEIPSTKCMTTVTSLPDPFTLNYTLSIPYSFTYIIYIHGSDSLQDLTTHKGSLTLPVHLSTRLLVARKSIESKKKKKRQSLPQRGKPLLQIEPEQASLSNPSSFGLLPILGPFCSESGKLATASRDLCLRQFLGG